jgi:hypothetical protein
MKYNKLIQKSLIYNDNRLILEYNTDNENASNHHIWFYNDDCVDDDFYGTGRKRADSDIQIEKGAFYSSIPEFITETRESDSCSGSEFVKGKSSLFRIYHHTRNEYDKAGRHHRNYKKEKVIFAR